MRSRLRCPQHSLSWSLDVFGQFGDVLGRHLFAYCFCPLVHSGHGNTRGTPSHGFRVSVSSVFPPFSSLVAVGPSRLFFQLPELRLQCPSVHEPNGGALSFGFCVLHVSPFCGFHFFGLVVCFHESTGHGCLKLTPCCRSPSDTVGPAQMDP